MITIDEIRKNPEIKTYISMSNRVLSEMGFTEHGFAHVQRTSDIASHILEQLGYDKRTCELAQIAGYIHDVGNLVNRHDHAQSGAIMAFRILTKLAMEPEEVSLIVSAIGHHDEKTAQAISPIAAALILADKSDVRRSRVRNKNPEDYDIHDRVNSAVKNTELEINPEKRELILKMKIDTEICAVMDYFTIFLERMTLCKRAASYLGLRFELLINNSRLL